MTTSEHTTKVYIVSIISIFYTLLLSSDITVATMLITFQKVSGSLAYLEKRPRFCLVHVSFWAFFTN
jgi:hypothetical protein